MRTAMMRIVAGVILLAATMGMVVLAVAQQDALDKSPLTAEQAWMDIHTFRMLYAIELTTAQAQSIRKVVAALQAQKLQAQRQANAPGVLKALTAIRDCASRGVAIPDAMWEELEKARRAAATTAGEPETIEMDGIWRLALNSGYEILPLLSDEQVTRLAAGERPEMARELVEQISQARLEPREEWNEWKRGLIADITAGTEDDGTLAARLDREFEAARALTPDDFFQRKSSIHDDLRKLLMPTMTDEESDERAAHRLADLLVENTRLATCLDEYVTAVGAKASD